MRRYLPAFPLPAPRLLAIAVAAALPCLALAAERAADTGSVFELGKVVVSGERDARLPAGETALTREDLDRHGRDTVGEAVNALPGVSLSRNSRNEDIVYVRGFDARQVPVFLDGIPLYVPYDGYVDFGRFTTFDLAEVRAAKGAASLLYGPNIMGGAINLVTRKPERAFEGDLRVGAGSGGERKAALNLGGRQGRWYYQAGLSWLDADGFPLPDGFVDYKRVPTDTGDERDNADRDDRKLSLKLGFMPNETDEYALGYVRQEGEKGNPVYTGRATSGIRYWRWPWWDKDSLYFIGNARLGEANTLRFRLYRDEYGNGLEAYTDARYATQMNNQNFPSVYADLTRGASVELANTALAGHDLRLAAHYKEDEHTDTNPNSPRKHYRDVTASLAVEDDIALGEATRLRLGASHERREAREVHDWPTGSTSSTNGLAEIVRDLSGNRQLFASVARKTRFPTIKDRYSARMGAALPNPDLKPEQARHLELGLRGDAWGGAHFEAVLFHSRIDDLIQTHVVASTACGGSTCNQAQNIAEARHQGVELSLRQDIGERWRLGAAYTWLDRDNLSDASVRLLDSPRHKLFGHLSWSPSQQWEFIATVDAESGRHASFASGNVRSRELPGFATLGLKAVWKPGEQLAFDVGGRNLGDKWYELSDGFPMPGRSWFAHATYRF